MLLTIMFSTMDICINKDIVKKLDQRRHCISSYDSALTAKIGFNYIQNKIRIKSAELEFDD